MDSAGQALQGMSQTDKAPPPHSAGFFCCFAPDESGADSQTDSTVFHNSQLPLVRQSALCEEGF